MQKRLQNIAWLLILVSFLLGCSSQDSLHNDTQELSVKNRHEAAKYNTQLGLGYLQQGDQPRAKRKLLAALRLEPSSPEANAAMAYFFEKTNDLNEASMYYKKALSLDPKSGSQKNNYGIFLCRTGHYKEAMKLLIEAANDTHYDNSGMAYENAGLCAEMVHDTNASMKYFLRALEQDRHRRVALYEYTKLALSNNQAEKSLEKLDQYAHLTQVDPELTKLAIKAAYVLGKQDKLSSYKKQLNLIQAGGTYS